MKRTYIEQEKTLRKRFFLFSWKFCCICQTEFRREIGFSFISGPFFNGYGVERHICKRCAGDKEIANLIALEFNNMI